MTHVSSHHFCGVPFAVAQNDPLPPGPIREAGCLFINGFPSGPKPYEEVLTFLRKVISKPPKAGDRKWTGFGCGYLWVGLEVCKTPSSA